MPAKNVLIRGSRRRSSSSFEVMSTQGPPSARTLAATVINSSTPSTMTSPAKHDWARSLAGALAVVDSVDGAMDGCRGVTGEEGDHIGDVEGLHEAPR